MALSDPQSFIGDGSTRDFTILGEIPSESHLRVWIDDVLQSSDDWDLLGNTVLFDTVPTAGTTIQFVISTTGTDFPTSPSDISDLAANIDMLKTLRDNLQDYTNKEFIVNGLPATSTEGDIAMNVEDGKIYQYQSNVWVVIAEGESTYSYPNPVDVLETTLPTSNLYNGKVVYISSQKKMYIYNNSLWTLLNNDGVDGIGIIWKGSYASASFLINPQEGWAYRNTTDKVSYIYKNGAWTIYAKDGLNGADGNDGSNGVDGYTPVKGVDYFDGNSGVDGSSRFHSNIFKTVPNGTSVGTITVPSTQSFNGYNVEVNNGWNNTPVAADPTENFIVTSVGVFYEELDVDGKLTGNWEFTGWSTPIQYTLQLGVDFFSGANGSYTSFIYKISNTIPLVPFDGSFNGDSNLEVIPEGWTDNVVHTDVDKVWMCKTVYNYDGNAWVSSGWSTPTLFYAKGEDGTAGEDGAAGLRGSSIARVYSSVNSITYYTNNTYLLSQAIYAIVDPDTLIKGDQVIVTATDGTEIFEYNGSSWGTNTALRVNGNAIIDGTLYANKLAANAISGQTITISSSTNAVGGTTPSGSSSLGYFDTSRDQNAIGAVNRTSGGYAISGISTSTSSSVGVSGRGVYGVLGESTNASGYWGLITQQRCYSGQGFSSPVTTISFTGGHTCFANIPIRSGDILEVVSGYLMTIDQSYTIVTTATTDKSKRVFGVASKVSDDVEANLRDYAAIHEVGDDISTLGDYKEEYRPFIDNLINNNYKDVTSNSIGEGGINVCSINGDIENGDYITSSKVAGKGMKQDDDLLHNYTVAKALDSIIWDDEVVGENGCFEQDGVKCKMIACTYHCG